MFLYDCCYSVFTNHAFRKSVFYSLLFVMTLLTIHDILDLCKQYKYDDKKAEMSIVFNDTMTFPNMTFCMSKRQAWSHFKLDSAGTKEWDETIQEGFMNYTDKASFLKRHWDFRMVVEAYQVVATLNSMERETTAQGAARSITGFRLSPRLAQSRAMINMWLNAIKERNVTFAEFQQKVGFETLKRSLQRFQRLSYNEDDIFRTKTKITWLSLMQLCFQPEFHDDSFKPIDEQGEFFTLSLSHNSENLAGQFVDCLTVDLHGRPTDLARNMEGKGRIRDGVANELCMSQRHEVEVEVAAQYVTLASEEPPNACKCYEPGDESEFDCKSRCRMDMLKEMCNCTAHTLSYLVNEEELEKYPLCSYEKCVINLDNFTFTDQECSKKCLPDCVQTRYNLITTNKGNSSRPDITLITLFWSSFEYLQLQQDFEWTPTTFFAALGGSLGLWLGLSILSFIQLLIFISAMLSRKVTTKKIAIQPAGMAMTEKGKPSSTASLGALTNRNKFNAPPSAESTSSVPAMAVNDYNRKAGIRPAAEQRGFNKLPVA